MNEHDVNKSWEGRTSEKDESEQERETATDGQVVRDRNRDGTRQGKRNVRMEAENKEQKEEERCREGETEANIEAEVGG